MAKAVVGVVVADADFQIEINLIEIQDRMATNHLYQNMHHKNVSYVVFGDMKQINVDGYIVDFHIYAQMKNIQNSNQNANVNRTTHTQSHENNDKNNIDSNKSDKNNKNSKNSNDNNNNGWYNINN